MTPELDISLVIKNEKSAPRRALKRQVKTAMTSSSSTRRVRLGGHYIDLVTMNEKSAPWRAL